MAHSIHCRGYRGRVQGFDDSDCDCGETITLLQAEVEQLRQERRHLARVARWFAGDHPAGTDMPDWCSLAWSCGEPAVEPEDMADSEAAENRDSG